MRREPKGTYPTYKQARSLPYARPSSVPVETKYFDVSFGGTAATAADWTGTMVPCVNYIQSDGTTVGAYTDGAMIPSAIGAGYGQVQGSKYYLKRIRIKGALIPTVTSDSADVLVAIGARVMVIMDTQPQGAQANGDDIFTDMGTAAQSHFSFLAMAAGSGGRFQVLKDKLYTLQPGSAGTDGANTNSVSRGMVNFKCNYNWKKPLAVQLKANSATPTVASLSNYNIFVLVHCTSGVVTTSGCARAYYTD